VPPRGCQRPYPNESRCWTEQLAVHQGDISNRSIAPRWRCIERTQTSRAAGHWTTVVLRFRLSTIPVITPDRRRRVHQAGGVPRERAIDTADASPRGRLLAIFDSGPGGRFRGCPFHNACSRGGRRDARGRRHRARAHTGLHRPSHPQRNRSRRPRSLPAGQPARRALRRAPQPWRPRSTTPLPCYTRDRPPKRSSMPPPSTQGMTRRNTPDLSNENPTCMSVTGR
jgi:hypothetical protein